MYKSGKFWVATGMTALTVGVSFQWQPKIY
ncbi:KxYKxGKxW signal peptide domain-containing protein [Weissella cibaria]|nr:KxYKxGKxW signal peptide domain-containing protein [Weissella cibaria]MDK9678390.1 KxYKxGKxW signal peptide domain-containing protein [Weissella cibaria]